MSIRQYGTLRGELLYVISQMSRTPLYKKIKEQIIQSLVAGEWQPGDVIPNEKQLAERFGVAISTIRAAIGELVTADVLTRAQGKGTFVTRHTGQNEYRFFNLFRSDGSQATFFRQLIKTKKEAPNADTAQLLELNSPDEKVFKLRVHLNSHNAIIAVSDLTVPEYLFPDLDKRMDIEGDKSIYAVFQTTYNVHVVRIVEQLTAERPPAAVAKILGLKPNESSLQIKRTAYTFNSKPVEFRTTWVHTKNHHFLISRGDLN